MKQNTEQVLAWIGLSEGGYVVDKGGPTDRGITQRTYDAWNDMHRRSRRPVRGISKSEAEQIIASQYMAPIRFDDLPSGLDYAVADFSVNSGPAQAVKELQRVVGVAVDGVMGAQTLAALRKRETGAVIEAYLARRLSFMRGLSNWPKDGKGWQNRLTAVKARALSLSRGAAGFGPDVPAPAPAPAKAREADRSASGWLKKAAEDPVAAITAASPLAVPLINSQPIQIALAIVIVGLAAWALVRALKRSA